MKDYAQNFAQCDVDSPWKYGLSDWWSVIKRTWKEAHHDNVSVIAAGVAFFSLLAVFPLITAALSTFSYFADPGDVQGLTSTFATLLPGEAYAILEGQVNSVLAAPPINASFGIVLSLGFAFISAGAGIRAMMRAMNVAYEEVESRNPAVFFLFGMLMTLGSLIFVWASLFVIIGVSAALAHTNIVDTAGFSSRTLPWMLLVTIFCFACGVMYRFGPSRRPARKRWVFPGIAFALVSWLAISFGFSKFVVHFGAYNETFGGLASVIILLIWLWLTAMVIIVGAELNSELERQTIVDTTRGPCRPLGSRGASMADFVARDTELEMISTKSEFRQED
ncbi:MAG: YihY/virulence factor BrkB family protein [Litorimonas sp.]